MLLKGSCHCGAVHFSVESQTPYPYMRCYCSICRKTQGGGGYAINIMGVADTLKIKGEKWLSVYRAKLDPHDKTRSPGKRYFCSKCGSALWVHDPRWAENVYPFASAIDTPLPTPPEVQHIMLNYAPDWIDVPKESKKNPHFDEYPEEAIIDWHTKRRLIR